MKNILVLVALMGLIVSVVVLSDMALNVDPPNACVVSYNSALADLTHVQKEMRALKELVWKLQEKPINIPQRRALWDI